MDQAFLDAELDEERFEVGVEIVVEELGHTELADAGVGKAYANVARFRGFGGHLDGEDDGRVLHVTAQIILEVLQIAGRGLLHHLPVHALPC